MGGGDGEVREGESRPGREGRLGRHLDVLVLAVDVGRQHLDLKVPAYRRRKLGQLHARAAERAREEGNERDARLLLDVDEPVDEGAGEGAHERPILVLALGLRVPVHRVVDERAGRVGLAGEAHVVGREPADRVHRVDLAHAELGADLVEERLPDLGLEVVGVLGRARDLVNDVELEALSVEQRLERVAEELRRGKTTSVLVLDSSTTESGRVRTFMIESSTVSVSSAFIAPKRGTQPEADCSLAPMRIFSVSGSAPLMISSHGAVVRNCVMLDALTLTYVCHLRNLCASSSFWPSFCTQSTPSPVSRPFETVVGPRKRERGTHAGLERRRRAVEEVGELLGQAVRLLHLERARLAEDAVALREREKRQGQRGCPTRGKTRGARRSRTLSEPHTERSSRIDTWSSG